MLSDSTSFDQETQEKDNDQIGNEYLSIFEKINTYKKLVCMVLEPTRNKQYHMQTSVCKTVPFNNYCN